MKYSATLGATLAGVASASPLFGLGVSGSGSVGAGAGASAGTSGLLGINTGNLLGGTTGLVGGTGLLNGGTIGLLNGGTTTGLLNGGTIGAVTGGTTGAVTGTAGSVVGTAGSVTGTAGSVAGGVTGGTTGVVNGGTGVVTGVTAPGSVLDLNALLESLAGSATLTNVIVPSNTTVTGGSVTYTVYGLTSVQCIATADKVCAQYNLDNSTCASIKTPCYALSQTVQSPGGLSALINAILGSNVHFSNALSLSNTLSGIFNVPQASFVGVIPGYTV